MNVASGIPDIADNLDVHSLGRKLNDIYQFDFDDEDNIENYGSVYDTKSVFLSY